MGAKQAGKISDFQFAAFCVLLVGVICVVIVCKIVQQTWRAVRNAD